jgi:DNA-binding transcriptional ArsR family regulator
VAVDPDVARVAALIGDEARSSMLLALTKVDGLPATELAARAGVSAPTASLHLGKLVEAGLLAVEPHGRHRYFRLADRAVAKALEALAVIAPPRAHRSRRAAAPADELRAARTCYDHLAGRLGVALADALVRDDLLLPEGGAYRLATAGRRRLGELGIDVDEVSSGRRAFARRCLDWSERRYHVAGALGAALGDRLFELGWVERVADGRAVRLVPAGERALRSELGVQL